MRMRLLAVGTRMPAWVNIAVDEYRRRFPRDLSLELVEIAPGARGGTRYDAAKAMGQEAQRLTAKLDSRDHVVALEVDGRQLDTQALAKWLQGRREQGQDLAFLIGGADGLDCSLTSRIQERLSLSPLTLPHAIARVVLIEQLYRAWTITAGHPYHRAAAASAISR
ncbi:MAG: 23S rRNA (pseudouridine(1915)-N(3))-methyltransferase RlmH [Pseudomonadota bacterium]